MDVADIKDPYSKYRKLLSVERVREFSQLRTAPVIIDTMLCWLTIIGAWTVVYFYPVWWVILLSIPIIGARYYALFIIGHDGMHYRLFNDHKINELFNDVFIFAPIGAITRINKRNHLMHHQYLATNNDPDRYKQSCLGKETPEGLFLFLTGVKSVILSIKNVMMNNENEEKSGKKEAYTLRDIAILLLVQAFLIFNLTYFIGWWAYPLLWMVPLYFFWYLMDNFRTFAEHSHPESDAKADQHRLITYLPNFAEKFFFAPMNMNYHAAHHLWVSIPYYNLPIVDSELRKKNGAKDLIWRQSYLRHLANWILNTPITDCGK